MFKGKAPQIQAGDRFTKTADVYRKVWEVVALWTAVDGIPHARLKCLDARGGLITVAAGVLLDLALWRPDRGE
jgi:hypothetical protein